jgi:hypothetical protein
MSESTLQTDLQRELLRLTALFSAGDVTICDWGVLDGSSLSAPFAIIDAAEQFDMADVTLRSWSNAWIIPFDIVVRFIDWDTSRLAIRDARTTVIDALRDTTHYHASSTALAWGLRRIASGSPIEEIYDKYNESTAESLPAFLSQTINLEVQETGNS